MGLWIYPFANIIFIRWFIYENILNGVAIWLSMALTYLGCSADNATVLKLETNGSNSLTCAHRANIQ